ncbi:MAG: hypothetical protein IPP06_00010 [Saprospiraceae bacterium]|nr:hypothetical protein [Candidatus Vicinibacter affinis]
MKKNIFVSHISEEEFVATSILEILKERFKDKINFFHQHIRDVLNLGIKWLEKYKRIKGNSRSNIINLQPHFNNKTLD